MTAISFSGSSYFQFRKPYTQRREEQIINTLTKAFKLEVSDVAEAQKRLKTASSTSKTTFREKCTQVFLSCMGAFINIGFVIIHPMKTTKKVIERIKEPSPLNSSDPLKTIQSPTDLTKQVKALKELPKGQEKAKKKVEIAKDMGKALAAAAKGLLRHDYMQSGRSIQDPKTLKALASAMVVDLIANAKLTKGTEIREAIQIGHFALCYALIEQIGNSKDPEEVFSLLSQLKEEATEVANRYGKDPKQRRLIFEKIYAPLQTGVPRANLDQIYKNYLTEAAAFPEIAGRIYDYDTLCRIETVLPADKEATTLIKKRLDPKTREKAFEEFFQEKEKEAQKMMDLCIEIERLVDPDFSKGTFALQNPETLQKRIEDIPLTKEEVHKASASIIDTSKMNKFLQPIYTKIQSRADKHIPSLTSEDFSLGRLKKEEGFSKGYTNLWNNFPVLSKLFPQHGPEQARQRREKMLKDLVGDKDLELSVAQTHAKPMKVRSSAKNTLFSQSSDEESSIEPRGKLSSSAQRLQPSASSPHDSDAEDFSSSDEFSSDSEVPEVDVLDIEQ